MSNIEGILQLAKENNGIITTSMVVAAGFSRGNLKYLVDLGLLERSVRGVYILPETLGDEFVDLQTQFKRGIFSLDTALFLMNLSDRTPNKFHMTFPGTYNLSNPKEAGVICNGAKEPLYSLGVIEVETPDGNKVKCYNAERTLCDILRTRNHTDVQIVTDAFKRYVEWEDKDIPLLSEYAKQLKVEKRLRAYLEVLL